jgi:hypothetical protein
MNALVQCKGKYYKHVEIVYNFRIKSETVDGLLEPQGTFGSVVSLLVATLYQGNHERNHNLWNMDQLRNPLRIF